MNESKKVLNATAVLTLALALAAGCKGSGKKDEKYQTQKIDRGTITSTVTATGTLSAVTTVQIGSQVSGVISRLYADFNSQVKKGQLLAELDPTPFQAQVEQRRADVQKAQVDLANANLTLSRQKRLVAAGLTPQADLDNARATAGISSAQLAQAKAALEQAQTNLGYAKIVSPIDGTVVDRQYDVGQTVAASFQAPTLFSIAQDLTKMQVQADVDQSDIGRVQVGQTVRFNVDAYPDEEFRGRISQMRLNATVAQNVVSYPVIIEVPNPGERLRPKMTANVTIDTARVDDVLRVPNAALRFKPDVDVAKSGAAATSSRGGASTASSSTSETTSTMTSTMTTATASTTGGSGAPGEHVRGQHRRGMGGAGGSSGGTGGGAGGFSGGGTGGGSYAGGGAGAGAAPRPKRPQTVYILDPATKQLKGVQVRLGISDGHFTQVIDGTLKAGDDVVVGLATTKVEGPAAFGGNGPGQRGPGGAGGGRGR